LRACEKRCGDEVVNRAINTNATRIITSCR
jgi:hypothetical protein